MRPTFNHGRFSFFSSTTNPGLSPRTGLVYNDRQNLPLSGIDPQTVNGISPTSEAAMNSARPDKNPTNSTSPGPASGAGVPETRAQRLERIKREIQDGTYETEEKLERAIERMLGVLVDG